MTFHRGSEPLIMNHNQLVENVSSVIDALPTSDKRLIVAVAGPPAVGKSTFAELLVDTLNQNCPETAALVPMDGFHLDNKILESHKTLDRKGSPETFDFDGFQSLLVRMLDQSRDLYLPTFDRSRDNAISASAIVNKDVRIVVVEGNYLLLNLTPWNTLAKCFDHSVFLDAPVGDLRRRLIQRWLDNGLDKKAAIVRAEFNDIPNALLVLEQRVRPDQTISNN